MTDDRKQTKSQTSCRTFLRGVSYDCDVLRDTIFTHRRDVDHARRDGDHEEFYMCREFLRPAVGRLYIDDTYSAA